MYAEGQLDKRAPIIYRKIHTHVHPNAIIGTVDSNAAQLGGSESVPHTRQHEGHA
jgi:hypothetical protein